MFQMAPEGRGRVQPFRVGAAGVAWAHGESVPAGDD